MTRIISFFRVVAVVVGLSVSARAAEAPFREIIAFGDSLTDVGNVAGLTEAGTAPVIDGYYQETHFSDNILWIEWLAEYWGLPERTPGRGNSTSLKAQPRGNTWAWGGSAAASGSDQPDGVTEPIPNLLKEVNSYLLRNTARRDTLYTIWSGADNLLVLGKFGPKAAEDAVQAVTTAMWRLEYAGARHIVVFDMPKLGDTPNAQSGGPVAIAAANLYGDSYNAALRKKVAALKRNPFFRAKIYFVDTYTFLAEVVATVKAGDTYVPDFFTPGPPVAINNVTDEGLDYFQTNGTFPSDYLFWDAVHPTTQGHQMVAGLVLRALNADP
jgi:phospholipase/lecithinase/hemolysin